MVGSTQAPRRTSTAGLFSIRRLLYNLVDYIFIFLHHLLDSYWRTSCIFSYHPIAMDNGMPESDSPAHRKNVALTWSTCHICRGFSKQRMKLIPFRLRCAEDDGERKKCNRQDYCNLHATQNSPIFMHRSRSLPCFVSILVPFPMKRKWPRPWRLL